MKNKTQDFTVKTNFKLSVNALLARVQHRWKHCLEPTNFSRHLYGTMMQ